MYYSIWELSFWLLEFFPLVCFPLICLKLEFQACNLPQQSETYFCAVFKVIFHAIPLWEKAKFLQYYFRLLTFVFNWPWFSFEGGCFGRKGDLLVGWYLIVNLVLHTAVLFRSSTPSLAWTFIRTFIAPSPSTLSHAPIGLSLSLLVFGLPTLNQHYRNLFIHFFKFFQHSSIIVSSGCIIIDCHCNFFHDTA